MTQQKSVQIVKDSGQWFVLTGENGIITKRPFATEDKAKVFAKQEEVRLGMS